MRLGFRHVGFALAIVAASGCSHGSGATHAASTAATATSSSSANPTPVAGPTGAVAGGFRGFDSNDYPGDDKMAALHKTFAFTGYWLTNPPGENANTWKGKRAVLRQQGWGFLALANGRLDNEILKAQKSGTSPAQLARKDAAVAVAAARSEGFPAHTILFLDQEEGGLLLDEQAAYLLAWTEAVAASEYRPGVYASGQPVPNGPGQTITTIEDIRAHVVKNHLHPIAMFDAQDACPPAPGCTVNAKPLSSSWRDNAESGRRLGRVAVLAVAAPAGADARLREHLRGGRQLLCSRGSHGFARHGCGQQRRPLARPLERPTGHYSAGSMRASWSRSA